MPQRLSIAMSLPPIQRVLRSAALLGLALVYLTQASGCFIFAAVGGMAESYKRTSTRSVDALYTGLEGKSFAVIVTGDRVIQGSFPTLFSRITAQVTNRLVEEQDTIGAAGAVPANFVLEFQFSNPTWTTWAYDRIASELGVERLIVIEIIEYRLQEPGNAYLWNGVAAARLGIVESESPTPGEFEFKRDIRVAFPNEEGIGPQDMNQGVVQGQLDRRFVDRLTWLMYEHQEPYYPEY